MEKTDDKPKKSDSIKTILTVLVSLPIGAALGLLGNYWTATEGKRIQLLQESRREAYMKFLEVQSELDLQKDAPRFAHDTTTARKNISIYGDKTVLEAVARHWREIYNAPICCGKLSQLKHDLAIYRSMRIDIVAPREDVNDADMMFLQHLCEMPESEAQQKLCQPAIATPEEPDNPRTHP